MLTEWSARTFDALSVPAFRLHWYSTLLAFGAIWMSITAQSIVAFDLEGTNSAVGIVTLGNGVAWFAFSPYAGVMADRLSKRRVLMVAQSGIAVVFTVVGVLIITGQITLGWLVASTFLMGLAFAFTGPARRAFVAHLVPQPKLANAVGLTQLALSIPGVFGPALAGLMIGLAFVGGGGTYIFMASLMAITLVTLAWMPSGAPPPSDRSTPRSSVRAEFTAALRHIWERPRVRLYVLTFLVLSTVGFPFFVLLPGLLENELGHDASDIGLVQSVSAGAGLVVGISVTGLLASRWAPPLVVACGLLFGVGLIGLAAVPTFAALLGVMLVVGAGFMGFQIVTSALIMTGSDPAYHGRVMAVTMLAFGAQGIAGLPIGLLGDAVGERTTLAALGAVILLLMLAAGLALLRIERAERRQADAMALDAD